jgi:glutamate formiminotransferase / 5-formyltetrahydrofolate cyclo-ligase
VLACVVNVSEGRSPAVLDALAAVAGADLLDTHVDPHHHRAVLTLVGEDAPRAVTAEAVRRIDLRRHAGAHPRLGAVDVVPFVPLAGSTTADAVAARDRFASWLAAEVGVPAFRYGPDGAALPEVRRSARRRRPDTGGPLPHPTAGATAVGARGVLVAYNLVLAEPDLSRARTVAAAVRGPAVRALGLRVGGEVQVSMNLVVPAEVGPAEAFDAVAAHAAVARAELVGLVPESVLHAVDRDRWEQLDLAADRTIEARLAATTPS